MREGPVHGRFVVAERTITGRLPVDLYVTVAPLQHGSGDPCHRYECDGTVWRASQMPSGAVTYRLAQRPAGAVHAAAWGSGAEEFLDELPQFLCVDERVEDFAPSHTRITEAHRRLPGLRMLRTGRVFESLVPVVLEQKVHTVTAVRSWRLLVNRYGENAPGPAPKGLMLPPPAEVWRRIPSWEFHRANVGPARAATIVRAAEVAEQLERTVNHPAARARSMLHTVAGIGEWTSAEIAQRVYGDADALSVGDFHLAATIGTTLLGHRIDDDHMVEYLEPLRPHRYRAVRLLLASGLARRQRRGPRTPLTDHSRR